MTQYMTIQDSAFDRSLTLGQAYRLMETFVTQYADRGDTPVVDFLTYLSIANDGMSSDPAALYDFLSAATQVLAPEN